MLPLLPFRSLFHYTAFLAKEVLKAVRIIAATFHVRLKPQIIKVIHLYHLHSSWFAHFIQGEVEERARIRQWQPVLLCHQTQKALFCQTCPSFEFRAMAPVSSTLVEVSTVTSPCTHLCYMIACLLAVLASCR